MRYLTLLLLLLVLISCVEFKSSETKWTSRSGHQVVVRDGAFYLFGGSDGAPKNDVWSFRLRLRSSD